MKICRGLRIENSFESIFNLLFSGKIKTISASHHFSKLYSEKPTVWKYLAFQHILKKMVIDNEKCTLISIGDSSAEFVASQEMTKLFKNLFVHRIKLKEKPLLTEMNKSLSFIASIASVFDKA